MIDSVNNQKVVFYKKLREAKYIKEYKKFIIEGKTLVEEAYKAGILECVLLTNEDLCDYDVSKKLFSKKCLEKISLLKSVPDIMGVVKLKETKEIKGNKIVLLDNVQDPGNVGTIIRSALAFNVDTVVLSSTSVNIFNDKLIRSSEGMIFKVNVVTMDLEEAINKIKEKDIKVYYADMFGKEKLEDITLKEYALVMGSEGQGVSKEVKNLCDSSISINMNPLCESLNVGVSASIIMHKFME